MERVRLDISQLRVDSFVIPRAAGAPGAPPNDAGPDGATEGSSVGNCCCA
jgi:hypothetical protein